MTEQSNNGPVTDMLAERLNRVNLHAEESSKRSSISSNNSYFPVRHGLSLLPVFDGRNVPVNLFTND